MHQRFDLRIVLSAFCAKSKISGLYRIPNQTRENKLHTNFTLTYSLPYKFYAKNISVFRLKGYLHQKVSIRVHDQR